MSFMKRLDEARKAYASRDGAASAAAHDPDQIALAFQQETQWSGRSSSNCGCGVAWH